MAITFRRRVTSCLESVVGVTSQFHSSWDSEGAGTSDSVNQKRAKAKMFSGILLLILTPVFLFVMPVSRAAVLRDLVLVIWWAFIVWLLVSGMKESRPTDSK
jgi:hypothetical protein